MSVVQQLQSIAIFVAHNWTAMFDQKNIESTPFCSNTKTLTSVGAGQLLDAGLVMADLGEWRKSIFMDIEHWGWLQTCLKKIFATRTTLPQEHNMVFCFQTWQHWIPPMGLQKHLLQFIHTPLLAGVVE
jgi:hypothetical protein